MESIGGEISVVGVSSSSSSTVKRDESGHGFCVAARVDHQSQPGAPTMAATQPSVMSLTASDFRKKRGRPTRFDSNGSVAAAAAAALSPMPISASIPLAAAWEQSKVKPFQTVKKVQKLEFHHLGDRLTFFAGANFTPHVITVKADEDVAMKILSFSQQEGRAICVLSASGSISNVTLCHPNSSGGTLTYEGSFEILSLSGSFMPNDNGVVKSRTGGMSVSLAGPDGRVLGGGLAGLLVAATPVQVVIGTFLPGQHQEQKPKKARAEAATTTAMPAIINPPHQQGGYGVQRVNFESPPPSFNNKNLSYINSIQEQRTLETDHNISFTPDDDDDGESQDGYDDDDDDEDNLSPFEISG